jgi:hypothetical protein
VACGDGEVESQKGHNDKFPNQENDCTACCDSDEVRLSQKKVTDATGSSTTGKRERVVIKMNGSIFLRFKHWRPPS